MGTGEFVRIAGKWGRLSERAEKAWRLAARDMTFTAPGDVPDIFLWERAVRVTWTIPHILQIVALRESGIDHEALFAASLYHDAGWALQARDGQLSRWEVLARPTSDLQRDLAAVLVLDRLERCFSPGCLATAATIIRQINVRDTGMPEAQLLAEADNLDEFGPVAIWQMVRQNAARGRGFVDCIDAWHSQQEYHFWEARLDRFRFPAVRKLARKRLGALEQFIRTVTTFTRGDDLAERTSNLAESTLDSL